MEHIRANMPVGDQPAEITRFVVRTFAKGLGRGPTKARAYVMGDLVTVLLRETFTRPERVLYEHGQFEALGVARAAMQRILREPLSSGVELATGKTVASLHIDHQVESDIVAINFVLATADDASDQLLTHPATATMT